jgi:DNA-binding response OmpR family regulator
VPDAPCILIVDDDRELRHGMTIRLTAGGYRVLTAHDGALGFDAAKKNRPDAILLDVRMPGTNGLTMLTHLRECQATNRIPVVVISASVEDHTRRQAFDLGARYFLPKPFRATDLINALDTVTRRTRPDPQPRQASGGTTLGPAPTTTLTP